MQTPTQAQGLYVPGNVPSDPAQLPRFLETELQSIAGAIAKLTVGHIEMSYVAPTKPREGDIRLADGTSWNPGLGQGVYGYYNRGWHYLG